MVAALDRVKAAGYRVACLTNNVVDDGRQQTSDGRAEAIATIMERFDVIVESSKVGVRKPEPRFYEIACELLMVEPHECVFLDDLGINLKPAAAMGMTTIKVDDGSPGDRRAGRSAGLDVIVAVCRRLIVRRCA